MKPFIAFLVGVIILAVPFASHSQTVSVVSGWNLVGNSTAGAIDVPATFGNSKATTVWKWDRIASNWGFYSPTLADGGQAYAIGKGYIFLTSIGGGEGFWVNANAPFSFQLPANNILIASAIRKSLVIGWNLVSTGDNLFPSDFNRALSGLPILNPFSPPSPDDIPTTNFISLWAWNSGSSAWHFYAPSHDQNGTLATYLVNKGYLSFGAKILLPSDGIWVNSLIGGGTTATTSSTTTGITTTTTGTVTTTTLGNSSWWPPKVITPMGVKVIGANQFPSLCESDTSQCWRDMVVSGLVKFVATDARILYPGYEDRAIVFAYFKNATTTSSGGSGYYAVLPFYLADGSIAGNGITGGFASEIDWVVGSPNGIIFHGKTVGLCYETFWSTTSNIWDVVKKTCP